eukprot:UN30506
MFLEQCTDKINQDTESVYSECIDVVQGSIKVTVEGYESAVEKIHEFVEENGLDLPCCDLINLTNDVCLYEPCFNGGACEDTLTSYTCSCDSGFEGDNCEIILYYWKITQDYDPLECAICGSEEVVHERIVKCLQISNDVEVETSLCDDSLHPGIFRFCPETIDCGFDFCRGWFLLEF